VAVDAAGNLVIADPLEALLQVVAAKTGTYYGQAMTADDIYTIAGGGTGAGNGVPATKAAVEPYALAIDSAGNLVLAVNTEQVRVVAAVTGTFYGQAMTAGDIYTIAGTGAQGFTGDGGPAVKAELDQPDGVAVDSAGNVVIDDYANQRVRVVAAKTGTYYGQAMTAGDIYTVAGGGNSISNGSPATSASLNYPEAVTIDATGNLVIADTVHYLVRVVAVSTGTYYGQAMTAGDIYTIAGTGRFGSSGDGGPATEAELGMPDGLVVDSAGNVVITDAGNSRVQVVAENTGSFYGQAMTAGDVYTVAGDDTPGFSGDGGPATSAEFAFAEPDGLAIDQAGNLLIVDSGNSRIREVTG
jgi:secreted PhoX family phosphatase